MLMYTYRVLVIDRDKTVAQMHSSSDCRLTIRLGSSSTCMYAMYMIIFHGDYMQWILPGRSTMEYELCVRSLETLPIPIVKVVNGRDGFSYA
jgi:hypothetical protein